MNRDTLRFWFNLGIDACVGIAFAAFGFLRHRGSRIEAFAIVLVAVVAWPLIEYLVHRWLMHGGIEAARRDHELHHDRPDMTFTTPWVAHFLVGLPSWSALAAITSGSTAALLMSGVYAGYTWFRLVHRMVHFHAQTLAPRFFAGSLRLHELHHDRPTRLFGVTTSFWDRVFGTL